MTASSTSTSTRALLQLFAVDHPLVQAPMAGVSTAAMAAAVANAGALESIGVGATDASGARAMIADFRQRAARSLSVNVFQTGAAMAPVRGDTGDDASRAMARHDPAIGRHRTEIPHEAAQVGRAPPARTARAPCRSCRNESSRPRDA